MNLYGLLASNVAMQKIPDTIALVFAGILGLAFLIGFIKGFRKVAWGGFYWLFAGVAFLGAYKLFANKNPFSGTLQGSLAGAESFIWTAVLLVCCIALSLSIYGVLGIMFRPREVEMDPEEEVDQYGFVYEDDREEDYNLRRAPIIYIKGGAKPKLLARVAGGFMAAVNVGAVLAVLVSLFLIMTSQTSLCTGSLKALFDSSITKKALSLVTSYAFDFFTIGIVIAVAYKGYTTGFLGSICAIFATAGILLIGDLVFVLPFTNPSMPVVEQMIGRCETLFTKFKPEYRLVFAKLTAATILAGIGDAVVIVIAFALKKLMDKIESNTATLIIDEIIAVALYLVIGLAIVIVMWAGLYFLDYSGIFKVSKAFNEHSSLSKEFFNLAEQYLQEFAEKYLLKFRAA